MSRVGNVTDTARSLGSSPAGTPRATTQDPCSRWSLAWLALTAALALHVVDEAVNDFLSVYNPAVEAVRARLPWSPLPTFTYEEWFAGLMVGILMLALLTPLARGERPWMRSLSYAYGAAMTLNGLGHIGASLVLGRWMPGVFSSPFLLAAALFLLASVPRQAARSTR